jgi:dihydroorotate dehydrogenase subfamily 2
MELLYRYLTKPLLFRFNPERVHERVLALGAFAGRHALTRRLLKACFGFRHPSLETTVAGIRFANPVGLAAGFDKNARLTGVLGNIGFGFAEVGSITAKPCAGNKKPRLWRLPEDKAIIVNYGLPSEGASAIAKNLASAKYSLPIGVSIARTNLPDLIGDDAIEDYATSFSLLSSFGSYVTINVSCPNASDGRQFCEPDLLDRLLIRIGLLAPTRPVFVKLKPDMTERDFDDVLEVSRPHRWLTGFIISNLTSDRSLLRTNPAILNSIGEHGGVSGEPVREASNRLLSYGFRRSHDRFVFIGCGGIFSGADAYEKIRLGASLVQLVTGMIYNGPSIIGRINRELVYLLKRDGFTSIKEAVGSAHHTR